MTDAGARDPRDTDAAPIDPTVELLWVETLREIGAIGTHSLRNALNAVAVNLEVVRSRAARGGEASALSHHANLAASQLEVAARATDALFTLLRSEPESADIALIAGRLATMLGTRGGHAVVRMEAPHAASGASLRSRVGSDVARTVLARALLDALPAGTPVTCAITVLDDIFVEVRSASGEPPRFDPRIEALCRTHGVRATRNTQALRFAFPPAHHDF